MRSLVFILIMISIFGLYADEKKTAKTFDRTATEWISLYGGGGNYGFGGGFIFPTVRRKHFYWETARAQITYRNDDVKAFNFRSIFGIPFFLTNDDRHKIRLGTGVSAGYVKYWKDNDTPGWYKRGNTSYFLFPIEVSYVFHIHKYFSFFINVAGDFPVQYFDKSKKDAMYIPMVNGFMGFRI